VPHCARPSAREQSQLKRHEAKRPQIRPVAESREMQGDPHEAMSFDTVRAAGANRYCIREHHLSR
jgi:hypothetical protein